MVGKRKKKKIFFFSYFISKTPNFFYMRFLIKYQMFRRSIPLKTPLPSIKKLPLDELWMHQVIDEKLYDK